MADDEERSQVDDLVDLLVYAPIGLLYEYQEVLPVLIRRGKSQVQLAKVVGKMAAGQGGAQSAGFVADALIRALAERVTEIGASIGLAPPASGERGTEPAAGAEVDDVAGASPAGDPPSGGDTASRALSSDEEGRGAQSEPGTVPDLPIASYGALTAREVIGLLDELDDGQLARVRAYEEANRARKTVLGKLDRLGA